MSPPTNRNRVFGHDVPFYSAYDFPVVSLLAAVWTVSVAPFQAAATTDTNAGGLIGWRHGLLVVTIEFLLVCIKRVVNPLHVLHQLAQQDPRLRLALPQSGQHRLDVGVARAGGGLPGHYSDARAPVTPARQRFTDNGPRLEVLIS